MGTFNLMVNDDNDEYGHDFNHDINKISWLCWEFVERLAITILQACNIEFKSSSISYFLQGEMGAGEDEWYVPASDDEGAGDEWEPEPQHIVEMYNKLAKGESLPLEWTLPIGGRRSPSPAKDETEETMEEELKEEEKIEEK